MAGVVVVGAGLAGVRTAEALRRRDHADKIIVVGDETEPPYDRPALSKDILLGRSEPAAIGLLDDAKASALKLDVRLGVSATALDVVTRTVTLSNDEALRYDELVIATGSRARTLPFAPLTGVHVLRTLADALAIRAAFATEPHVAVIGGGVIGCEVAASARTLGLDVAIVDTLPVLMQRVVGNAVGERLATIHREAGVALHLGTSVTGLVGDAAVEGVALADGTVIAAELVVVGVGAVPNVEWLDGSGLTIEGGVLCDTYLEAAPHVHAVGDVARWHHAGFGEAVRAEHWTAAIDHAEAVARTLTGEPTTVETIPYVWSDQYGRKLQIAGRIEPGDEVRFLVAEENKFLAVFGSDGIQHAAVSLAAPPLFIKQKLAMSRGEAPWPPMEA